MRGAVKSLIYTFCMVVVFPLVVLEWAARQVAGHDVFFAGQAEALSLVPGKTGQWLRNAFYHLTLKKCPLHCCFSFGSLLMRSETEIGNDVYIGVRCIIGTASIGDDTMLADHVQILSGKRQHESSVSSGRKQDQQPSFTRVQIGRNCWLGANAIVMADVGDNCVIGAGSVVTRPIPSNSVAVGSPARVVRSSQEG